LADPLYLDYAATTPVDERVLEAMWPYFTEEFGNASSSTHVFGWRVSEAVQVAREQVSALIGCIPEELIFTSGATESCNLALRGVADSYASKGNHIITCATEHRAVLDTCSALEKKGMQITVLHTDQHGRFDMKQLKEAITPQTILIACMHANNETGVLHPVAEIGKLAKEKGILFFCDATQSVGKIPVNVETLQADLLAFAAHKFYGPKGIGALYVRRKNPRVQLISQITGGGHERNLRSGTLNVPGIVGFGKAAMLAVDEMQKEAERLSSLRLRMETIFRNELKTTINGSETDRLPTISNCCFHLQNPSRMMGGLVQIAAISSGSACSSASQTPSHVLTAMGLSEAEIKSSVRFSLGRKTDADSFGPTLNKMVHFLKELQKEEGIKP